MVIAEDSPQSNELLANANFGHFITLCKHVLYAAGNCLQSPAFLGMIKPPKFLGLRLLIPHSSLQMSFSCLSTSICNFFRNIPATKYPKENKKLRPSYNSYTGALLIFTTLSPSDTYHTIFCTAICYYQLVEIQSI